MNTVSIVNLGIVVHRLHCAQNRGMEHDGNHQVTAWHYCLFSIVVGGRFYCNASSYSEAQDQQLWPCWAWSKLWHTRRNPGPIQSSMERGSANPSTNVQCMEFLIVIQWQPNAYKQQFLTGTVSSEFIFCTMSFNQNRLYITRCREEHEWRCTDAENGISFRSAASSWSTRPRMKSQLFRRSKREIVGDTRWGALCSLRIEYTPEGPPTSRITLCKNSITQRNANDHQEALENSNSVIASSKNWIAKSNCGPL